MKTSVPISIHILERLSDKTLLRFRSFTCDDGAINIINSELFKRGLIVGSTAFGTTCTAYGVYSTAFGSNNSLISVAAGSLMP